VARSVGVLSEHLGGEVSTASVPGGLYSEDVGKAAVAAGIDSLFMSLPSRRIRSIDGCRVIGRYAVRRHTPAERVAAAAAGDTRAWASQRVAWGLLGAIKRVAGPQYERVRRALLER
jgi:hypothetical protein